MASLEASLKLRDQFTAVLKTIDSALNHTTQTMSSFKQKAAGPAQALQQMATAAASAVNKMNSSIRSGLDVVMNVVRSTTERILTLFGNFGNRISSKLNLGGVTSKISSAFSGVTNKVSSLFSGLGNAANSAFNSVVSAAKGFGSGVSSAFKTVSGYVRNFGSNLGNAFNGAKNSFKQFGHDLRSGFSGIKESTGQATNGVKSFVAAIGLMKAASAIVNTVKSSLDGAIDRFDTLNQFPKMMQAVGFSADQAANAKDKLVAGIDGLPTTLGEVVSTTQRIATMTKDLDGATKTTLALNNAFLASGSDSAKASQGLEQYIQMLGKGEVDMQSWRSLQDTMGVALNEVAESFGFAGRSAQNDLYKALQDGNITFDQFNNRIIKMSEATGGFAERALIGSEGIKTSFKNIRTAVTNGVEGSIRKIDSLVEKITGKNIAKNLDGVKQMVKNVFAAINGNSEKAGFLDRLPGMIEKLMPYIDVLKNAFNDLKEPIGKAVSAVKKSLSELTGSFGSKKNVSGFQSFVESITESVSKLAGFIEKHSDSIAKLISLLPKLAAAFIGFKIGKGVLSPFLTFGKGLTTVLAATGKLGGNLAGNFLSIFGFGKSKPGSQPTGPADMGAKNLISPLNTFLDTMNSFAKGAKNIILIFGVIKLIEELAQALKEIDNKVPKDLSSLAPKLINMGIALVGMGTFVKLAEFFSKNAKGATRGLAVVAGISANLIVAASAMKAIDSQVPADIGNFASKMANMGIALGGMGMLVLVAGKLASMNPNGAIAGLVVVAGLSLELMLAAEAMKQVNDKIPSDIGDFASKIANMAIALGSMGALVGVVGGLMATGIGALIGGAGLAAVAALAGELMLVSEAIAQMDAKVPDDYSSVKTKIDNISKVIGYFTEANLGSVLDLFKNAVGVLNIGVVTTGINKFVKLASSLEQFDSIEVSTSAGKKIKQIQKVIESIAKSNLADLISSGFTAIDTSIVIKTLDNLIDIGNSLTSIDKLTFDAGSVKTKIKDIKSVIDSLGKGGILEKIGAIFGGKLDTSNFGVAKEAFSQLNTIGNSLVSLQGVTFEPETVKQKVKDVNAVIESLGTSGIGKLIGTMIKGAELNQVKSTLEAMGNLEGPLNSLRDMTVAPLDTIIRIQGIQDVIRSLDAGSIGDIIGTMVKKAELTKVRDTLIAMTELQEPITAIQGMTVAPLDTIVKIQNINSIVEALGTSGIGELIGTMVKSAQIGQVKNVLIAIKELEEHISNLRSMEVAPLDTIIKIQNLNSVIEALSSEQLGTSIAQMVPVGSLAQVKMVIDQLSAVRNAFLAFMEVPLDVEAAKKAIKNVKDVINELNGFPEIVGLEGLYKLVATFNTLTQGLTAFIAVTEISLAGLSAISSSFAGSMSNMQTSVETAMQRIQQSASKGMTSFIATVSTGMSAAANAARSGSSRIVSAFSSLRSQLFTAGSFAMSGLSAGIRAGAGDAIAAAQSVASRVASTVRSALDIHSPSRVMMAIGGFVSEGLANGILAAQDLVQKASDALAMATIPDQLATVAANGTVTSSVHVDDEDISRLKASTSSTVVVQHKQVVPQVTIHIDNKDGEPIDEEALLQKFEDKVIELIDADLS